jgi:hypothetical protein
MERAVNQPIGLKIPDAEVGCMTKMQEGYLHELREFSLIMFHHF